MKLIIKFLAGSILAIAGTANAAMITITGDVYSAENYGGLTTSPGSNTITAEITFDDILTGVGTETIYFDTSNSLNITAGTFSFNESMKSNASTTSITFKDGYLFDFSFSALFEENLAPEQFHSSLTTATADRNYTSKGKNVHVGLYTEWDTSTQFITTVPVPAAVWLFGSGLLGLVGIARRKTR